MTLVSQIITDAFRRSNLLAIGSTPTANQQEESLRYLNRIVKGVFGIEVGNELEPFPIGRHNIEKPSGYPWWDVTPSGDWFIPKNTRIVLNLESTPPPLYLHPQPDDGSRFAYIDMSSNLSTYPVTIHGNGALIDGSDSITIDTNGASAEYFFRADLGNWQKYSPLELTDTFPFPEQFDDYFIILLGMQINPTFGVAMDDQTQAMFTRVMKRFKAQYQSHVQIATELALIRMPREAADRDRWASTYRYYDPTALFDRGVPY